MSEKQPKVSFTVRLDADNYAYLKDEAKSNCRTLSGQIEFIVGKVKGLPVIGEVKSLQKGGK